MSLFTIWLPHAGQLSTVTPGAWINKNASLNGQRWEFRLEIAQIKHFIPKTEKKSGKKSKKERKFDNLKITWRQPDAGQKSNFEVRYASNNRENDKNVRFQAKSELYSGFFESFDPIFRCHGVSVRKSTVTLERVVAQIWDIVYNTVQVFSSV